MANRMILLPQLDPLCYQRRLAFKGQPMFDTIRGVSIVFALSLMIGAAAWGLTGSARAGGTAAFLSPFPLVIVVYRVLHLEEDWREGGQKIDLR